MCAYLAYTSLLFCYGMSTKDTPIKKCFVCYRKQQAKHWTAKIRSLEEEKKLIVSFFKVNSKNHKFNLEYLSYFGFFFRSITNGLILLHQNCTQKKGPPPVNLHNDAAFELSNATLNNKTFSCIMWLWVGSKKWKHIWGTKEVTLTCDFFH